MTPDEKAEAARLKAQMVDAANLGRRLAAEGQAKQAKADMARVAAQALILALDGAKKAARR